MSESQFLEEIQFTFFFSYDIARPYIKIECLSYSFQVQNLKVSFMSFCASRFEFNGQYKRQNETHKVFFKLSNKSIRQRSGQCCDHISSIEPEKNDVINYIYWKLHPLGLYTSERVKHESWVKIGGYSVEWESCKHDLSIFGQMHLAVNFLVQANFAFYSYPAVVKGRAEKLQLLFLHLLHY